MRAPRIPTFFIGLTLLFQIGLCSAETRPAFLVLTGTTDEPAVTARLESQGVRIRTRVPPSILTVDMPTGLTLKDLNGVKIMYQSAIPLSALEPLGVIATAAGMRWNRSLLSQTAAAGMSSYGAMRSLISQKSLSAPLNVTAAPDGSLVRLSWNAVASALFYEVEASLESGFSRRFYVSKTAALNVNVPAPEGSDPVMVFYRVRAIDHGDDDKTRLNNVFGAWSNVTAAQVQPTSPTATISAPVLSSPLNKYRSRGFTLILEWNAPGATRARVQVALDKTFNEPLFDTVTAEREFICPSPALEVGDTLYWRVKVWDSQKSAWSDVRQFQIGSPENEHVDVFVNPEAPR